MANMLILSPQKVAAIAVSRGSDGAALLTADPRDAWVDSAVASPAFIDIDYGIPVQVDTIFLGYLTNALGNATWSISGGIAGLSEFGIQASSPLRVPDATGRFATISHALWHGSLVTVRFLRISILQPAGVPISAGIVLAGKAFQAEFAQEWGAGRRVIDSGTATPLPTGGFAIVEGGRKGSYSWTFGDLAPAEVEELYAIALESGETRSILVVEDPDRTAGLRHRIHYGLFDRFRPFDRRDPRRTRWELSVTDWI